MAGKTTKEGNAMLSALVLHGKRDDLNAFTIDEGGYGVSMRYDSIVVAQRAHNLLVAEFLWHGVAVYTLEVDCNLSMGQTLTLTGIKGRMAGGL